MNPDTIQTLQNIFLIASVLLSTVLITCLIMGGVKHCIKMFIMIIIFVGGIVYLNYNKESLIEKYEYNLVNNIIWNRVNNSLKVQLPK